MDDWLFEAPGGRPLDMLDSVADPFAGSVPVNLPETVGGELGSGTGDWAVWPNEVGPSKDPDGGPMAFGDDPWTLPGDDGTGGSGDPPPPLDPPPPPPPPPPPTTLPFDYSDLYQELELTEWLEWLDGYAPTGGGGDDDGYDSLEEFMHGEWHMDIDPELIDFGSGGPGAGGLGGPTYGGQYGTILSFGFTNAAGVIVPIFREWVTSTLEDSDGDPTTLEDVVYSYHRQIMGYERVGTIQVASTDPFDSVRNLVRGAQTALTALEIVEMFQNLGTFMSPPPDTVAITDYVFNADGTASAMVLSPEGQVIGRIVVNENGYTMYDRAGNALESDRPLFQEWNTMQGVNLNESLASQEHRMGVPFADFLVSVAQVPLGAVMSAMQQLGFGFIADALTNRAFGNATARARFEEAAFELRRMVLSRRGG